LLLPQNFEELNVNMSKRTYELVRILQETYYIKFTLTVLK